MNRRVVAAMLAVALVGVVPLAGMGLDTSVPITGTVTTDSPPELHLRWPDGAVTTKTINPGTQEVLIP
jgi:hypothetical protein